MMQSGTFSDDDPEDGTSCQVEPSESSTLTPENGPDDDDDEDEAEPSGAIVRTSKTAPITWENYDLLNRKKRKILLADIQEKAAICRARTELIRNEQYNLGAERLRQVDGMLTEDLLELTQQAIEANKKFAEVSESRVQGAHNRNAKAIVYASKTLVKAAKDMAEYVRLCNFLPQQGGAEKKPEAPQVAIQQNLTGYGEFMKSRVNAADAQVVKDKPDSDS